MLIFNLNVHTHKVQFYLIAMRVSIFMYFASSSPQLHRRLVQELTFCYVIYSILFSVALINPLSVLFGLLFVNCARSLLNTAMYVSQISCCFEE